MSKDLKLYKLIQKYATDYGWDGDTFYIMVDIAEVGEFVRELREIVGDEYFQDDGMHVRIQLDTIVFDELNTVFEEFDFEGMFEK